MSRNDVALNKLRSIIGDELYKIVCDEMAGLRPYIKPFTLYQSIVERDNTIREEFYSGASVEDLAVKNNLSESRIRDIIYSRKD